MTSLTHPEETPPGFLSASAASAQEAWQERWEASVNRQLDELRLAIRREELPIVTERCAGQPIADGLRLSFWGASVEISWPDLTATYIESGLPCSAFDTMALLYYLRSADGAPLEYRWVSFRELRGGTFYFQAFQSYSGDRLAKIFDPAPEAFHRAAQALQAVRLTGLGEYAYAFDPLPRVRLAALFWPGDEEFPSRGSILFDASSLHYMVLDGLAVLGARLVSKLEKSITALSNEEG